MKASLVFIACGIVVLELSSFGQSSSAKAEESNFANKVVKKLIHLSDADEDSSILKDHSESEAESYLDEGPPGECELGLERVELPFKNNASSKYYPPFLLISKCNGSCSASLASCQPMRMVTRNYKVMVYDWKHNSTLNERLLSGYRAFSMEEAVDCKCSRESAKAVSSEKQLEESSNRPDADEDSSLIRYHSGLKVEQSKQEDERCSPELQTLRLRVKDSDDGSDHKNVYYHQIIGTVKRCVGVTMSQVHSCQPVEKVTLIHQVLVKKTDGNGTSSYREIFIPVDDHISCAFSCIEKPKCNNKQRFDPSSCHCYCSNFIEAQYCRVEQHEPWNSESCTCVTPRSWSKSGTPRWWISV